MATTVKTLPHSQVELHFTLDPVKLEVAREAAFTKLSQQVKVPGFRPGKAPRKLLEEHMNPSAPMQQALDEVLNQAFQEAIREQNIVPLVQPEINISSVDLTKPIDVVATIQVRPEVEVGDWQKIKVAKEATSVDEAKVEETLKTVFERSTAEAANQPKEGGLVDAQGNPLTKASPADEPAMDDAWARKLGAKDLADLRSQIKTDLETHAEYEAESAWQDKVLEQIIAMTKVDLPPAFVDDELNRMRSQFEQQLASLQVSMDQYLQQSGKTREEIEEQWKPQAVKQATMEVALAEIAHQSKIQATDEEVEAELAKADSQVRAQFADPEQRYYLTYSLWRQKVLKYVLSTVAENSDQSQKTKK
jgi:trigger factor